MRQRLVAASLAIAATLFVIAPRAEQTTRTNQSASTSCDRRCLLQFLTDYTEALTDNNTSRLVVAPTMEVTSNGNASALARAMSGVQGVN